MGPNPIGSVASEEEKTPAMHTDRKSHVRLGREAVTCLSHPAHIWVLDFRPPKLCALSLVV